MPTRSERAAEAARLRGTGLLQDAIAARMGISRTYVSDLLTDPTGEKIRRRKDGYRIPCPGWDGEPCGRLLDGSYGRKAWERYRLCPECRSQQQHHEAKWTLERIVAAMQQWAATRGHAPTASEWVRSGGDEYPATATVVRSTGWSTALRAAGLVPGGAKSPGRVRERMIQQGVNQIRRGTRLMDRQPGMPSQHAVSKHFGGWRQYRSACYAAAGTDEPEPLPRGWKQKSRLTYGVVTDGRFVACGCVQRSNSRGHLRTIPCQHGNVTVRASS